jgi:hypothetical protein
MSCPSEEHFVNSHGQHRRLTGKLAIRSPMTWGWLNAKAFLNHLRQRRNFSRTFCLKTFNSWPCWYWIIPICSKIHLANGKWRFLIIIVLSSSSLERKFTESLEMTIKTSKYIHYLGTHNNTSKSRRASDSQERWKLW